MEKTDLMKKYERESGHSSVDDSYNEMVQNGSVDCNWNQGYIDWLESKVEAYYRLLSGKGCEYCNPSFVGKHEAKMLLEGSLEYLGDDGVNDFNLSLYVSPNSPNIVIREDEDNLSDSKLVPIKYCPKCGRELEVK
ncbi:hypothetical protein [uncultured Sphaerochaeta sp.]|uniref:hypothetical protein n=1 Tax=uncultured Sphaerochaeta sp. TaxID=886478 RepID=UPI0029CA11C8|nr:hypothetical protein [uncultured Sphaerochaeta sp.]